MLRHCLLVLTVLLVLTPASAHAASTAAASRYALETTGHGIALTVTLPRRSFPRGAIIAVHLAIRNISSRTLYLASACSHDNPNLRVLNHASAVVYPPALNAPIPLVKYCQVRSAPPRPIRSGHSLNWYIFVVLRGARIQATVGLGRPGRSGAVGTVRRTVPVRLTSADPPIVTVAGTSSLSATVSPTIPQTGMLLYADWYRCTPTSDAEARYWLPADGAILTPPCLHPTEWHILAGYLNHSLGCADYLPPVANPVALARFEVIPIPEGDTSACALTR